MIYCNSNNIENTKKVEIYDSFKKELHKIYCCYAIILYLLIGFSLSLIIKPGDENTELNPGQVLFILIILWSFYVSIVFIAWAFSRGFSIVRKFVISESGIFISKPDTPDFSVNWSQFDIINIRSYYVYEAPGIYGPSTHFELNFIGASDHNQFTFITNKDFHKKKIIPQILFTIKKFAEKFKKEIIATNIDSRFGSKIIEMLGFTL